MVSPSSQLKKLLLRFTPSQANISPSELELIGQGDGGFIAKGTYLSLPGNWQVQAIVRRQDKFDTYANFNFTLSKPGIRQWVFSLTVVRWWNRFVGWIVVRSLVIFLKRETKSSVRGRSSADIINVRVGSFLPDASCFR